MTFHIFLPDLSAATFSDSAVIDNPYFPVPAGPITSFNGTLLNPETGELETERNDFFATYETNTILAIETIVIRDTAYDNGVLIEDTLDRYAQDDDGNVWYLGEIAITYEYDDDGSFIGTNFNGSWEAGFIARGMREVGSMADPGPATGSACLWCARSAACTASPCNFAPMRPARRSRSL